MKLITYLFTILMVIGSYASLHGAEKTEKVGTQKTELTAQKSKQLGDCKDGSVICNDGTTQTWGCKFNLISLGCVAVDYDSSYDAATELCRYHDGPNLGAGYYSPCLV